MKRLVILSLAALSLLAAQQFDGMTSKTLTPTSIGEIRVALVDPDGTNAQRSGEVSLEVLDQNGDVMRRLSVDLERRASSATLQEALQFLNALRAQAEAEVLP